MSFSKSLLLYLVFSIFFSLLFSGSLFSEPLAAHKSKKKIATKPTKTNSYNLVVAAKPEESLDDVIKFYPKGGKDEEDAVEESILGVERELDQQQEFEQQQELEQEFEQEPQLLIPTTNLDPFQEAPQPEDLKAQGDTLPLTLGVAVERTLKSNLSIAVQEFNSKIKRQDIIDRKSEFDPTVNIELSIQEETRQSSSAFASPLKSRNKDHQWDASLTQKLVTGADYELKILNNRNKTNSVFAGLNPQYSSEVELTLTQPLLKNFGIDLNKREIYIANNDVKISDFDFIQKVIDVISDMENVYWDLKFSIEDLKVKEKSLERAQDFERRVNAQVEVGTLAPLEILQAQSEVASREELLLTSEDVIGDNQDNLMNILNIDFTSPLGGKKIVPMDRPQFETKEQIKLDAAIKIAMDKRPDYLAKKTELKNKNILLKFNENQVYPAIDFFGSLGLNGISGKAIPITTFGSGTAKSPFGGGYDTALDNMFDTEYFKWQFGVKLSYPLGNRSAKSRLTASKLEVAQQLLDIKDLEKQIAVEVREAHRQIRTDIKRVQASRVARRLAEEKLSAEEKKFEVGLSTSFNVLEFQEDLAEEQSNEIKAIIDYNKSLIQLRRVMSTTLDNHNIKLLSKRDS